MGNAIGAAVLPGIIFSIGHSSSPAIAVYAEIAGSIGTAQHEVYGGEVGEQPSIAIATQIQCLLTNISSASSLHLSIASQGTSQRSLWSCLGQPYRSEADADADADASCKLQKYCGKQ
jgi:hypothetical protein